MTSAPGRGGTLSMGRFSPAVIALIVVLVVAIVPPFLFLGYSSLHLLDARGGFGAFTLGNFAAIFTGRTLAPMLINSVLYPLGAAVWRSCWCRTGLVGGTDRCEPAAAPIPNGDHIARHPLCALHCGVAAFPRSCRPIQRAFAMATWRQRPHIDVYSLGGMIFVEGTLWSPFAFLLLAPVLRNSDAAFEEAASMCGAGLLATFRRVTFGMVRPALLALGLPVFIKASAAFEVPALVGLQVYSGVDQHDISAISVGAVAGCRPGFGFRGAAARRDGYANGILEPRDGKRASLSIHHRQGFSSAGLSARPLAIRCRWRSRCHSLYRGHYTSGDDRLGSFLPYYQPFSIAALPARHRQLCEVLSALSFSGSILNTLLLGASAATLVTVVSIIMGWCVARHVAGSHLLDALAALPLVFPAIVLGLAFLKISSILVGQCTAACRRWLSSPLCLSAVWPAVRPARRYSIHPELEEAATLAGARDRKVLMREVMAAPDSGNDFVLLFYSYCGLWCFWCCCWLVGIFRWLR